MSFPPIKRVKVFFLIVAWATIFPSQALAYLDPGTGSLIIQSVIAGIVATAFAVRLYWSRILGWFKRPGDGATPPTEPPEGPSGSDH